MMPTNNTSGTASSEMQSRRPPAFQCYASDYIAQEEYALASLDERGLLFTLLNQCWVNDSVPADMAKLSKLLGISASELQSAYGNLIKKNLSGDPEASDRLSVPELLRQMSDMRARSAKWSESGRKGGKATQDRIGNQRLLSSHDSSLAKGSEKSRDELSGDEKKRSDSEKGNHKDDDEWLKDFDDGEPPL